MSVSFAVGNAIEFGKSSGGETAAATYSLAATGLSLSTLSIIPDPGSPPDVEPTNSTIWVGGSSYTIDVEAQIYETSISSVLTGWDLSVTNNGTVWLEKNDYVQAWFVTGGHPQVWNNGLIYLHGESQVSLGPRGDYLVNTGSIFAISDSGWARVISSDVFPVFVENSGLIAAQSVGIDPAFDYYWNATTIDASGWLNLVNHSGGQILAEAPNLAIAISGPGGDPSLGTAFVTNEGLIEANATGPDGLSIGILVSQPGYSPAIIINSGTIRADIAIYGTYSAQTVPNPVEHVENLSGGVIDGFVFLDKGDDEFLNHGTVIGDVDMGAGNDVFSGSGSVAGVVDMGFGNDRYTGSASNDRAAGGRGDDDMRGGGGRDLLLGGFGDDILRGDGGNDGLIGEWGDDVIYTRGGDYVEGNSGNDRVVLGDFSFEKVDGGAGFDSLVFAVGARAFDLSAMLATGRIVDFEALELNGGQRLVVRQGDVDTLTGALEELQIVGTGTDTVNLVGAWIRGSSRTVDGAMFETYTLNGRTVLVSDGVTVTVGAADPAGGLDPIASGSAAPRPGWSAGLDYTDPAFYLNQFSITDGDFTVDSQEIFYSGGAPVFYSESSDWTFTNNGEIYSLDDAYPSAVGLEFHGRTTVVNSGIIYVEELAAPGSVVYYPSLGVWMNAVPDVVTLENYGEITVYSVPNSAIAVNGAGVFRNEGVVAAISENSRAIAVNNVYASHILDDSQTFFNTGLIYAEAGGPGAQSYIRGDSTVPSFYVATGVAALGTVVNDGDIIAVLGANANPSYHTVGIYLVNHYDNPGHLAGVINNGRIVGTIAIKFANAPSDTNRYDHWVTNNGQIFGDIEFQGGNDRYDGSKGAIEGTVFGFGGADTLIGGKFADVFYGGSGNDSLTGNGGDDILEGGAGNDLISGGAGFDYASYSEAVSGVTVSLAIAAAQNTIGAGTDTLTGIEGLIGSEFADRLTGNAAANALFGLGGKDIIDGGAGLDVLDGGEGSDVYIVANASDHGAAEFFDSGSAADSDEVRFTSTTAGQTLRLYAGDMGIERIVVGTGTAAAAVTSGTTALNVDASRLGNGVTITGNAGVNQVTGTDFADLLNGLAGDDKLIGGAGSDTLDGGTGVDRMIGGTGNDTYYVDDYNDAVVELAGEGTDSVFSSANYVLRANVENLTLTGSVNLYGYGNESDNVLTGNSAANKLFGLDGNDVLDGKGGSDRLSGGLGDDTYYVDSYSDRIIEVAGEGIDSVFSSDNALLDANVENLTLTGTANIWGYGNASDNVLTGNSGNNKLFGLDGNDILDGGAGSDKMWGGTGDDTYYVDNYSDKIVEYADEGIDSVFASASYVLSENVEKLTLTGSSNLWAYGNSGDNVLTGNSGSNKLYGQDGDDTLRGEGGNDWLEGGAGRDVFYGGAGADSFVFRDGDFAGLTTSTCDQIKDFSHDEGDLIRLRDVDANSSLEGDQNFAFIGTGAFTNVAGQLRYEEIGGNTYVMGDTNGDGNADFMIRVDGVHTLTGSDFFF